jgi:TolA-binding protein
VSGLRVVDLHPEELLERDALGELDATESARLQAHLDRCSTCRFERQLRADFGAEIDAPQMVLPSLGLVADVLARASGPSLMGESGAIPVGADDDEAPALPAAPAPILLAPLRTGSRRRRAVRAVWLLSAAALLLLAGGAAAAIGFEGRGWNSLLGYAPRVSSPALTAASAAAPKAHSIAAPASPASPAPVVVEAAIAEAPAATPAPAVEAPAVVAHRAAPEPGPQELFDAETAARRVGDYARVLTLHRELGQRFPRSREAQVSRATVGHLLLDRGNPVEALAAFEAYLAAGSGNLGEEAMVGRATALDRLGRTADASVAWRALVAAFPDTPYAAHARARVESLIGN